MKKILTGLLLATSLALADESGTTNLDQITITSYIRSNNFNFMSWSCTNSAVSNFVVVGSSDVALAPQFWDRYLITSDTNAVFSDNFEARFYKVTGF